MNFFLPKEYISHIIPILMYKIFKKTLWSWLILVPLLGAWACNPSGNIPATMPDDFAIEYTDGGGMINEYKTISINTTLCFSEGHTGTENYRYEWKNTDRKGLEHLYKELKKIKAFTIPYKTEKEVYDRDGESIRYLINGKMYVVSNSGLNFISKKNGSHFSESIRLILGYFDKGKAAHNPANTFTKE